MHKNFILILLSILLLKAGAQTYTYQGKILDSLHSESLAGVHLYFYHSKQGVITNKNGTYAIDLPFPKDSVFISYLGYKTKVQMLTHNPFSTIQLVKENQILEEATVAYEFDDIQKTQSGVVHLSSKDLEQLPFILGEKDIIKILQFTPGVQTGKEGQTGLFVRGGNRSMNLYLIDDIYIHNISHLGGFFSAINPAIARHVSFIRSGIPANYGGRLSSVTDIKTSAKTEQLEINTGIGTVSSQININLPLNKINSSIQIAGRRSYFDLIQPFFRSKDEASILNRDIKSYFYDGFFKLEHHINKNNQLSFLYYRTKDDFHDINTDNTRDMSWGNDIYGLEWKHIFSSQFYSKMKISNSNYKYNFSGNENPYQYAISSKINNSSFKNTYNFNKNNHQIVFGIAYNYTHNIPKEVSVTVKGEPLSFENPSAFLSHGLSLFLSDEIAFNEKLKINFGLRMSSFFHVGDYFDSFTGIQYKRAELVKSFYGFEPRFNINYLISKKTALKFSYHRIFQYFHQATLSTLSLPIDFVYPSSIHARPQEANQVTLALQKNTHGFKIELESYYNLIQHLTEFKNGSVNNIFNDHMYQDIISGTAQSAGLELSVKKSIGRTSIIASYALTKSISRFKALNNGDWFSSSFDRPHNLNCLLNFKLNKRWRISATFIFSSGQNYTPPTGIRIINETPIIDYAAKNAMRYPNYHRADLSISYHFKTKQFKSSIIDLTIYNVYNNKNPFFINYKIKGGYAQKSIRITPKINTLFPFMPTIAWHCKF